MLVISSLLVLLAAADIEDELGATEPIYMTQKKAREIVTEKLPASMQSTDSRLGIITGTSVFQFGKIDRMIPISMLCANGDVTIAEAIPGSNITNPIGPGKVMEDFKTLVGKKEEEFTGLEDEIKKLKGTVVSFQLIDDMKADPNHPWIHSATYNKTSAQRKIEAARVLVKSWVDAMAIQLKSCIVEYIPPFNASVLNVQHGYTIPATTLAWMEGYSQSTRIVLVGAQLLKKFGAKGMAEGMKFGKSPFAVPMNVKDHLDLMDLAARKVKDRFAHDIEARANSLTANKAYPVQGTKDAAALIETTSRVIDLSYGNVKSSMKNLRAAVMGEHTAMKAGYLPKASRLLMAYAQMVGCLNNFNNASRASLGLPSTYISERVTLRDVTDRILHGKMAEYFYGKKLGANESLATWGLSVGEFDKTDGSLMVNGPNITDAHMKYKKLRDNYEARTPGYDAYDFAETYKDTHPRSTEPVVPFVQQLDKQTAKLQHEEAKSAQMQGMLEAKMAQQVPLMMSMR